MTQFREKNEIKSHRPCATEGLAKQNITHVVLILTISSLKNIRVIN